MKSKQVCPGFELGSPYPFPMTVTIMALVLPQDYLYVYLLKPSTMNEM